MLWCFPSIWSGYNQKMTTYHLLLAPIMPSNSFDVNVINDVAIDISKDVRYSRLFNQSNSLLHAAIKWLHYNIASITHSCNQSATSPRSNFVMIGEVLTRSPIGRFATGRRPIGDQSPTAPGPIGDLVATICNWSATSRWLVPDQSQTSCKTFCDRSDWLPTGPRPIWD